MTITACLIRIQPVISYMVILAKDTLPFDDSAPVVSVIFLRRVQNQDMVTVVH